MTLNELAKLTHKIAKSKGWYLPDDLRTFPELIALVHSEVSEALESWRGGNEAFYVTAEGKPEGWATELADVLIRVFDMLAHYEIDIDTVVANKIAYNKARPWRHGSKKI